MLMSTTPDRDSLMQVGHIHNAYGIQGWVWVMSRTDPIANIFDYAPWYVETSTGFQLVELAAKRSQGKGLVAKVAGCEDRNAAEKLLGLPIWVPRSSLPSLADDEYYWSDLIDMQVINEQGVLLGRLHAMMETGANDVMVLRACEGSVDQAERLLPWLPGQVIRFVNREQKRITVDWDPTYLVD